MQCWQGGGCHRTDPHHGETDAALVLESPIAGTDYRQLLATPSRCDGDDPAAHATNEETHTMPFEFKSDPESSVLEIKVSGQLHADDYRDFVPQFEHSFIRSGKRSLLFEMEDFHGWGAAALWEDLKFDARHISSFERIAMVGDKKWERLMTEAYQHFTSAEVRYFDRSEIDDARRWAAERKATQDPQPS